MTTGTGTGATALTRANADAGAGAGASPSARTSAGAGAGTCTGASTGTGANASENAWATFRPRTLDRAASNGKAQQTNAHMHNEGSEQPTPQATTAISCVSDWSSNGNSNGNGKCMFERIAIC